MNWLEILSWLIISWFLIIGIGFVRSDWQNHSDNPTRIFLADFAGIFLMLGIIFGGMPVWISNVINVDSKQESLMQIVELPAGIGKIERGDFVRIQSQDGNNLFQRLIGLPHDQFSIHQGIVHVNGIALGKSPDAFLPVVGECESVRVPPESVATMRGIGTESISCQDIAIRPIDSVVAHCWFVIWPFSQNCKVSTNEIPPPKDIALSSEL